MTYELAKELREAGFPLGCKGCKKCLDGDATTGEQCLATLECICHAPTLSELIEACSNMYELKKTAPDRGSIQPRWYARGWHYTMDANSEPVEVLGPTPEEAVARLWLALNKK